jgi:hypothetical protein
MLIVLASELPVPVGVIAAIREPHRLGKKGAEKTEHRRSVVRGPSLTGRATSEQRTWPSLPPIGRGRERPTATLDHTQVRPTEYLIWNIICDRAS